MKTGKNRIISDSELAMIRDIIGYLPITEVDKMLRQYSRAEYRRAYSDLDEQAIRQSLEDDGLKLLRDFATDHCMRPRS